MRADPVAWPLGEIGLIESPRDLEVVQHKLVVRFPVAEWSVRLGRLRFVFPAAMVGGGILLLSRTHAIANVREALLVELSHLPLVVLAVAAGSARWTELSGPPELAGVAAVFWPAFLALIGALLLTYREA